MSEIEISLIRYTKAKDIPHKHLKMGYFSFMSLFGPGKKVAFIKRRDFENNKLLREIIGFELSRKLYEELFVKWIEYIKVEY